MLSFVATGGYCSPYLSTLHVTSVPWIITEFVSCGAQMFYFLGTVLPENDFGFEIFW